MKKVLICLVLLCGVASATPLSPLTEYRYCGEPKRRADGTIIRRQDVLTAFKRAYPCPATGNVTGGCPGWAIDHVIPLVCGGCDAVVNLQWLPNELKSKAVVGKDRFERWIYETGIACNGRTTRQG